MKYLMKPLLVEAVQFLTSNVDGSMHFSEPMPDWMNVARSRNELRLNSTGDQLIFCEPDARDGFLKAEHGDWIVFANGKLYPVKADVFAATYQPTA